MSINKKKIAIGSDHAGFSMKEHIKNELVLQGYLVTDYGTNSEDSVDYPDYVHPVAIGVENGIFERAVILCGSGNGVNMTANKYRLVRSALCWNEEIARLARLHNDANILALPARFISNDEAVKILKVFLNTEFEAGRHTIRVEKIGR